MFIPKQNKEDQPNENQRNNSKNEIVMDVFRPEKKAMIQGKSYWVHGKSPNRQNGIWMGSPTTSQNLLIPRCLVQSEDGEVIIPVMNLGKTNKRGKSLSGKIEMERIEETLVLPLVEREDSDFNVFATFQPEIEHDWENELVSLDELNIDPELSIVNRQIVKNILRKHSRLFKREKGLTHLVEHRIETGDVSPIHSNPYRVSHKERQIIRDHISSMLQSDLIEPSNSPWSSPVVLAPKSNGSLRFCIDYRKINEISTRDVYPLPR